MKKETLEKILLGVLLMGGLIYSYITYLFSPQLDRIESLNQELKSKQKHYDQLLNYQGNIPVLEDEIKKLQIQNAELSAQIPTGIDKPQIMIYIYTLAKAAHVEPLSLSFEQPRSSGDIQSMLMNFSCLGNVNDVLTLTKKIQFEGTQKMGIQSISLVNQNGKIKADIKIVVYASNLKAEAPSKESLPPQGQGLKTIEQMFQP